MSIPVVAFFNNKGGVGKTSLVYHLAWMYADNGWRVVAADFDPQCNLTASFLDEDRLEALVSDAPSHQTVYGAVEPLMRGTGDIGEPHVQTITDGLELLAGDMSLSLFEDHLSDAWPRCLDRNERAFRVMSAFYRLVQHAAKDSNADLILLDLGPNLGAVNRSALIACDHVVVPLGPDLFSLQGLQNLGPALRRWRSEWRERTARNPAMELELPLGAIDPAGYLILRHSVRLDQPVKAFERWIARIPKTYAEAVLDCPFEAQATVESDPHCIARLKDYRSLMPMAQEVRKPMFFLKPADGALGAHTHAVADAYRDFKSVAERIVERIGLEARA